MQLLAEIVVVLVEIGAAVGQVGEWIVAFLAGDLRQQPTTRITADAGDFVATRAQAEPVGRTCCLLIHHRHAPCPTRS